MCNIKDVTFISFLPRPSGSSSNEPSFNPHSIKRNSDGKIFTIGDHFSNGYFENKLVTGTITGFSMLDDIVFVDHTWSGIGFGLADISKIIELPSQHQIREVVKVNFSNDPDWGVELTATVLGVHFYEGKVKYDVALWLGKDGNDSTRIYNVDSIFVTKV